MMKASVSIRVRRMIQAEVFMIITTASMMITMANPNIERARVRASIDSYLGIWESLLKIWLVGCSFPWFDLLIVNAIYGVILYNSISVIISPVSAPNDVIMAKHRIRELIGG